MNTPGQFHSAPSGVKSHYRQRRAVLFWIFVILSIPLVIVLVGYAFGYRFQRTTGSVIATSTIAVSTTPKEATIFLNGEQQEKTTPFIQTVIPGTYSIEVKKEGYHPWKKHAAIEPGKSMIFPDIILFLIATPFKRDLPREESNNTIRKLSREEQAYYAKQQFPHPENLFVLEGPHDLLIDQQQQSAYLLSSLFEFSSEHRIDARITSAEWNTEKDLLLYTTEFEIWTYDPDSAESTLITRQSHYINDATWHPEGGYIFWGDINGLWVIELDHRDQRLRWNLSTLPSPTEMSLSPSGKQVTFSSDGLYYDLPLYEK